MLFSMLLTVNWLKQRFDSVIAHYDGPSVSSKGQSNKKCQ